MDPDQNDSKAKTFHYTILDYSGSGSLFQVLNVKYEQEKEREREKEGKSERRKDNRLRFKMIFHSKIYNQIG